MTNKVVIGAQWGDEGKAKITDLLAQQLRRHLYIRLFKRKATIFIRKRTRHELFHNKICYK